MANLSIALRTNYSPSQINNVDILLAERNNINNTQFRIMTDFPDHLDLLEPVVLTRFGPLELGADYNFVIRVFLNEAPYIVHKNVIARIRYEYTESIVVFNAD